MNMRLFLAGIAALIVTMGICTWQICVRLDGLDHDFFELQWAIEHK